MSDREAWSQSHRPSNPLLRLEQVHLQAAVGIDLLLRDISFEVKPQEIVGIVGASGSGKTSLLRLINGLVSPSQGKIKLEELPVENYTPVELRRRLVLTPQEPKLLGMKVIDALSYPLQLQHLSASEIQTQVDTWINLLHIPTEWLGKTELQLSLGQRQLVAIARSLMMKPQVILLDEPTSALDIGTATFLLKILKKLNQEQKLTIIMVNHQLELIQDFCDRLLLLHQGNLVEDLPGTKANWQKVSQKIHQLRSQEAQEWSED
jgi:D-methionine transport system ATP-binding protein